MSTFLERIETLIGSTTGAATTTMVSTFLSDAAKEIINTIPGAELYILASSTADSGTGASVSGARFLYAEVSGRRAREVPAFLKAQISDADSIYKSTAFSPACYREANKVYVVGATAGGTVWLVSYPAVAYGDSSITNFPKELEQLVALRAAIDCRQAQLSYFRNSSFPTAPSVSGLVIGVSAPTAPSAPSIAYSDAVVGSLSTVTFAALPTAPTYIAPVSIADYTSLDTAYGLEDSELSAIQLQKVSTKLNEYQANIQNSVNSFNKEVAAYQSEMASRQFNANAELQEAIASFDKTTDLNLQNEIQTLTAAVQQYQATLGKYGAELNSYQQQVGKEVSQYQATLQGIIETFNASYQMALGKYQSMMQELVSLKQQYTFGLSTYVAKGLMKEDNSNGK